MKRIIPVVFLFLMLAFLSACAHIPEQVGNPPSNPALSRIFQRGELIVGTTGKQPPLNGTDKEGRVNFLTLPFSDLLPALEAGKVDMVISGMTITPKRNLKVAFVGPYFISGKSFVTKIQTIASLKDPSQINRPETILAALKGSTSQAFVEHVLPKAKLVLTEDYQEALQLVLEGKAHAMIADHHICILSVLLLPEEKLVALEKPLTYEPLGIALPGNDPLLVNLIQKFLGLLQGSGDLDKLKERWFKGALWGKETLADSIQF
jgi:polar amino acid transport system substrate-binding protein